MASLNVIPAQTTLQVGYSVANSQGYGTTYKAIPKNPDGSIFDCTGYNAASLQFANPTLLNPGSTTSTALVVGTADGTGIVLTIDESGASTLGNNMVSTSSPICVEITNGTDTALAVRGSVQLSVLP
jgi:hypothetical protein